MAPASTARLLYDVLMTGYLFIYWPTFYSISVQLHNGVSFCSHYRLNYTGTTAIKRNAEITLAASQSKKTAVLTNLPYIMCTRITVYLFTATTVFFRI